MRRLLFLLLLLSPQFLLAQSFRKKIEMGLILGTTHYLGEINGNPGITADLGGFSDIQYSKIGIIIGPSLRYQASKFFAFRTNVTYAQAKGDDVLSPKRGNSSRNLSFKTDIVELSAAVEFPIVFSTSGISRYVRSRRKKEESKLYGFLGLGYMFFNPTAEYKGKTYDLQPLGLEGVNYSRFSLTIPVGIGYSYSWARKYKIAAELGIRKTFTDYIDDIHNKYIEPAVLRANNGDEGDIAVALADRSREISGNEAYYGNFVPGQRRGTPKAQDYLIHTTVQFNYVISAKRRSHRAKF